MGATAKNIMRNVSIGAWLCIAIQPSAADTVTLRYGQIPSTVRSVSALYLFIAQQKGFLAREGVKLELVPIAGAPTRWSPHLTGPPWMSPRPPQYRV